MSRSARQAAIQKPRFQAGSVAPVDPFGAGWATSITYGAATSELMEAPEGVFVSDQKLELFGGSIRPSRSTISEEPAIANLATEMAHLRVDVASLRDAVNHLASVVQAGIPDVIAEEDAEVDLSEAVDRVARQLENATGALFPSDLAAELRLPYEQVLEALETLRARGLASTVPTDGR